MILSDNGFGGIKMPRFVTVVVGGERKVHVDAHRFGIKVEENPLTVSVILTVSGTDIEVKYPKWKKKQVKSSLNAYADQIRRGVIGIRVELP